jgi:hypothetical protein
MLIPPGLIHPLRNKFVEFVLLFVVEHVGCLLEGVDYSGLTLEPQIRNALCVFAQVIEVHRLGCQRVQGVEVVSWVIFAPFVFSFSFSFFVSVSARII